MRLLTFYIAVIAMLVAVFAIQPSSSTPVNGVRTLVVLDSADQKESFSIFFKTLTDRGYNLDFKTPTDTGYSLVAYEELAYDHLLMLAHSAASFKGDLTVANIIDFQNRGGNVLVAGSSSISEFIRDLAIEYSVDFDEKGNAVQDAFHTLDGSEDPTLITSTKFVGGDVILPNSVFYADKKGPVPVVFRGVGHRVTGKNALMTPVLVGHSTAYSYLTGKRSKALPNTALVGSQVALVSALQARNNARIVFSGSVDLFSDELIKKAVGDKPNANFNFAVEISKWVFQEKGVLKIHRTFHHRETEMKQHGAYRIKDDLVYEIEISEYHDNAWHPYKCNDLQFEAIMLDPYIRQNFTQVANPSKEKAKFEAHFKLPDVYGVFTFKVDHKRLGYSFLEASETVAIHPFRHNEYPRFLTAAYPYYVNTFSMIASFFVLSLVVLFHKSKVGGEKVKTN
ncbi:hypothetical protein HDU76_014080 [Blyttiomyces sp. JEL0837]|nr:hypothetical protein HDU76_014080 [Blyttiomyces sp. JEL0837]